MQSHWMLDGPQFVTFRMQTISKAFDATSPRRPKAKQPADRPDFGVYKSP